MKKNTVQAFLNSLRHGLDAPTVALDSDLEAVVRAMVKGHKRRIVYVVDADGCLKGAVPLIRLQSVIFRPYLKRFLTDSSIISENISEIFGAERAEDFMDTDIPVCTPEEDLGPVISRMMDYDASDIPVVDGHKHIIADLDILDILEFWLGTEKRNTEP